MKALRILGGGIRRRFGGRRGFAVALAISVVGLAAAAPISESRLAAALLDADRVVTLAKTDPTAAARQANSVFLAAHALHDTGRDREARRYLESGLELAPLDLREQIAYAHLLIAQGDRPAALKAAQLVARRAEMDALANEALDILGEPRITPPPSWDGLGSKAWLCFVKVGPVDDVLLNDTMAKIGAALGMSSFLLDVDVDLPKPDRSGYRHWVERDVIPAVRWDSGEGRRILKGLGVKNPEAAVPQLLIGAIIDNFEVRGLAREAENMRRADRFFAQDSQWDGTAALRRLAVAMDQRKDLRSALVVGVTAADLYQDNNNFLFGTAATGGRICLCSYARFKAEPNGEYQDRARLVLRMHKQLLSSIGFALGVPRPQDGSSARAFPSSVEDQDTKSEYMSPACVAGFERALGHPLPVAALPPDRR